MEFRTMPEHFNSGLVRFLLQMTSEDKPSTDHSYQTIWYSSGYQPVEHVPLSVLDGWPRKTCVSKIQEPIMQ